MSPYSPENIQLVIETTKLELLTQATFGGRASFDENDNNLGNYWTVSAWHTFCTNTRDMLEKLGCSDEEIGSLIQEATEKVHLQNETVLYKDRTNLK